MTVIASRETDVFRINSDCFGDDNSKSKGIAEQTAIGIAKEDDVQVVSSKSSADLIAFNPSDPPFLDGLRPNTRAVRNPDVKKDSSPVEAVLQRIRARQAVLKEDDKGPAVSWLQQKLEFHGYPLVEFGNDGHFGDETAARLWEFQRDHGLGADAIVGKNTLRALEADQKPRYHTVVPGDTLAKLAQRYRTSVEELAQRNSIADINAIEVDDRLEIWTPPKSDVKPPAAPEPPEVPVDGTPPTQPEPPEQPGDVAPPAAKNRFDRLAESLPEGDLKKGTYRAADVGVVQEALFELGYAQTAKTRFVDNDFGPATEAAMKQFQRKVMTRANPSGFYNDETRKAMLTELKKASKSTEALKAFQIKLGLPATGDLDRVTQKAQALPETLVRNDKSANFDVGKLHEALSDLGYDSGRDKGTNTFGNDTEYALKRFQEDLKNPKIEANGLYTPATRGALAQALAGDNFEPYELRNGYFISPDVEIDTDHNIDKGDMKDFKTVLLHRTGGESIEGAWDWWNKVNGTVAAHFYIAKDGRIKQTLRTPKNGEGADIAWHSGHVHPGLEHVKNAHSIGIEVVGEQLADGSYVDMTPAQTRALNNLMRSIYHHNPQLKPKDTHVHGRTSPEKSKKEGIKALAALDWDFVTGKPGASNPVAADEILMASVPAGHLTKNFTQWELTRTSTGLRNVPNATQLSNLKWMAENILQPLRDHYGVPIKVTSGFRSSAVNKVIGGSPRSDHLTGLGVDIEVTGKTYRQVLYDIMTNPDLADVKKYINQAIDERNHLHLGVRRDPKKAAGEFKIEPVEGTFYHYDPQVHGTI